VPDAFERWYLDNDGEAFRFLLDRVETVELALPVASRDARAFNERIHGGSPGGRSISGIGAWSASVSVVP
jgi:hypothetical protein